MELKEFVAQSLLEIGEGIRDAQAQGKAFGLIVAPPVDSHGLVQEMEGSPLYQQVVHFNLRVVVSENSRNASGPKKFSIGVASSSVGVQTGKTEENASTSHVEQHLQFDIPVIWPTNFVQEKRHVENTRYDTTFEFSD